MKSHATRSLLNQLDAFMLMLMHFNEEAFRLADAEIFASHYDTTTTDGCYRHVFFMDNVVLKVPKFPYRAKEMQMETQLIQEYRRTMWRHFFPRTVLMGNVQVQERCDPDDELYEEYHSNIHRLAEHLGIDDVHGGNVGWKITNNVLHPVFIDCEIRQGEINPEPMQHPRWQV